MPGYYNPYNIYPVSYANQMGYTAPQMVPQQSMSPAPAVEEMKWVEGEIGAKAYQMPPGLAPNKPIPLWDSTDTNIFLKSWGPMGIPNPLQKLHYTIEDQQQNQALLMNGTSGVAGNQAEHDQPKMENYATIDDLKELKEEIRKLQQNHSANNQNGSPNRGVK